jgi:hypothetical protein
MQSAIEFSVQPNDFSYYFQLLRLALQFTRLVHLVAKVLNIYFN